MLGENVLDFNGSTICESSLKDVGIKPSSFVGHELAGSSIIIPEGVQIFNCNSFARRNILGKSEFISH